MKDTNHVGDVSEYAVIAHLLQLGKTVLKPIGQKRYDLVIQEGNKFVRAQVKSSRMNKDHSILMFKTASTSGRGLKNGQKHYTPDEIDIFLVYSRELGKVYSIPVGRASRGAMSLRVAPARNNMQAGINWANEFEI